MPDTLLDAGHTRKNIWARASASADLHCARGGRAPGDSLVPANSEPHMTVDAPSASAFAMWPTGKAGKQMSNTDSDMCSVDAVWNGHDKLMHKTWYSVRMRR